MTLSPPPVDFTFHEVGVLRVPLWKTTERRQIELHPQRPCRPFAMLAWGCRPESAIHGLRVGADEQLLRALPGSWFSSLLSIEEFERLCEKRPDGHDSVRSLWRLFGYEELDIRHAEFGVSLTLDVSGPFERLVLLARMPEWTEWDRQFEIAKRRAALQ